MSDKISTFLWFDGQAEAAVTLYCSLLPDSRIDQIVRAPGDYPAGEDGQVLLIGFTLAGRSYQAMNGGSGHPFTDAISLSVMTEDQAETDRLWEALIADGGVPIACGWLKDRFGLSWQITPRQMVAALASPDRAAAKRAFEAMMTMVKIDVATIERAYAGEKA
jgi:predicted 3-demethylubiquinone-9 3-methyltransferase (glyoxalase superfamily)